MRGKYLLSPGQSDNYVFKSNVTKKTNERNHPPPLVSLGAAHCPEAAGNMTGNLPGCPFSHAALDRYLCRRTMGGIEAMRLAREVSKIPDGTFTIAFYPYNRLKGKASGKLRVLEGCKVRTQLPRDKFWINSENYFLFTNSAGEPKTAYRVLIRFMGFPQDNFALRKIRWI